MSREELKKVKQSLWESAIKLRVGLGGTHTCAEICLNLIFLKYITDKSKQEFEEEKKNFPEQLAQDEDYLRNCSSKRLDSSS
ncbi:1975_t:CDS:2, partial [Entrophospora sp. SA101]